MAAPVAEIEIDVGLVRGLLQEQHPDLSGLPLRRLGEGWDNVLFRLGTDLVVRIPRRAMSAPLARHEQRWLPGLAFSLPLAVPAPVRVGRPGGRYPWRWSVVPWIDGEVIDRNPPADWHHAAVQLGGFLAALHQPAPSDAPVNPFRGTPLADRAERFRAALDQAGDLVDRDAVQARWDELAAAEPSSEPPLWLHGDLHPLNILVHEGELSGVIDFGDMCAGDRATDLSAAWIVLPSEARPSFRAAAGARRPIDDDTWRRARAWALALGLAYMGGDDRVAAIGARAVDRALADG